MKNKLEEMRHEMDQMSDEMRMIKKLGKSKDNEIERLKHVE